MDRHSASARFHGSSFRFPPPSPQPPIAYTPPHLAERIRAVSLSDGERKTIPALFADIKGSMALLEDLDPEDARALVDPALQVMMEAVHRYDGYVVQSTGDGIFAFFGAPLAHEDHPQRALYAALRMQDEMSKYAETLRLRGHASIEIRVGLNTGEVVLRSLRKDDLRTEYTPIGHSTGLAQRMESLAKAGSVVVSEHTYRLTQGYFDFKPLGATQVKGASDPLLIYEVLGVGPLRTRLHVAARRGLVQFVGRQHELHLLKKALDLAKAGHGQIVGVMGEPGIGKSRLFYEFVRAYGRTPLPAGPHCLILETFSVSHGKAYPYLPLLDLLKNYFQIVPQDDERLRREKVTGKVLTLDRSLEDTLPYLFALLGLAEPTSALQHMDPQIRKQRTFAAIKRLLVRESLNQPLIVIFEDLHWLDSETQAFLTLLSESIATAKILLLTNYRPEYAQEWGNRSFFSQLRLDPLVQEDAHELLRALFGESPAVQPLKQFILEKTDGNPFFMEELVQALVEQGVLDRSLSGETSIRSAPAVNFAALRVPATVQAVLASRIDRLHPEEKVLLQTLSVIGKEVSSSLLTHVVGVPGATLQGQLAQLQAAEFIYEQLAFPESEYIFKHALTQEVAYNSLLIERRKILHEQTGQAIEALYSSSLEDHYSELAHHYRRSDNIPKAVHYLHQAGQQAVQRSANEEAISHLTAALDLLKFLSDTPERAQQELPLQISLGTPLVLTKGWTAPEVKQAYARARQLCQQVGETAQLFPVLWGLFNLHAMRGEVQTAHDLAEEFLALAQRVREPSLLSRAHQVLGVWAFFRGDLVSARAQLEQAIALYNFQEDRFHVHYSGGIPAVVCLLYAALTLWLMGYSDHALKYTQEAVALARDLAHPYSRAFSLIFLAILHKLRREEEATQELAERVIAFSSEQGFPLFLTWGNILRGWARAEQGQSEEEIAQVRQSLSAWQIIGGEAWQVWFLALLVEVHGKARGTEEGLTLLAEALEKMNKTEERWYEAELYRLKGQLTLHQLSVASSQLSVLDSQPPAPNPQSEAEAGFLKAIAVARRQQAKSLELRATVSLARMWQQQGKQEKAHEMLADIYNWFTEGFDTKDLQEAKALLDEMVEN